MGVSWLVGFLVFDLLIVDASIDSHRRVFRFGRLVFVWVVVFCSVCLCSMNDGAAHLFRCVVLLFLLSVCLASCEGRMVDALASRAEEGRWSLR